MTKKFKLTQTHILYVALFFGITAIAGMALSPKSHATPITVYKSPTCNCCELWVRHMEDNGFDVTVQNTNRIEDVKHDHSIPRTLYACHTTTMGDYIIEGHVPASDVLQLKQEKPDIEGIAVAGMPAGSPGMDHAARSESYDVVAFNGFQTAIFSTH